MKNGCMTFGTSNWQTPGDSSKMRSGPQWSSNQRFGHFQAQSGVPTVTALNLSGDLSNLSQFP